MLDDVRFPVALSLYTYSLELSLFHHNTALSPSSPFSRKWHSSNVTGYGLYYIVILYCRSVVPTCNRQRMQQPLKPGEVLQVTAAVGTAESKERGDALFGSLYVRLLTVHSLNHNRSI